MNVPLDFMLPTHGGDLDRRIRLEFLSRWAQCAVCAADVPRRSLVVVWDSLDAMAIAIHLCCAHGNLGKAVRDKIGQLSRDPKQRKLYARIMQHVVLETSDGSIDVRR
jgi:hypothetical protein